MAWCFVVALGGTQACSLFVSLDGLDGSVDAGPSPSADAAPEAESPEDARSQAVDGGPDAAGLPFCLANPGHTFCADFDEGSLGLWTAKQIFEGTVAVTTDASVSPPASLVASLPDYVDVPDGASTNGTARLELDSPAPTHAHVELDAKLCDIGSSPGYFEIFKLSTETGGGGMGIELQLGASDAQMRIDALASPFPLALSISRTEWTHVAIDVVVGTSGSLRVEIDRNSATPALAISGVDTTSGQTSGYAAFLVGLYTTQVSACFVHIDNVLIDAK
jgi:hypothetical protein